MIEYTREDIIEALEYIVSPVCTEMQFDYCDEIRTAIALLKDQEPRVMTKSEAEQYTNGEEKYEYSDKPPLYIEYKKAQPFFIKWATLEVVCAWMKDLNMKQEYGKTFRFWTFRPSPEQMRDTPWEGESE